ncbi:MAG: hypothetical protein FD135_3500 [Comamonadaceae bacterium]|nr:MAG: hypothetical protein FD135_3500 [Comamonadaceae bacterium]
MRTNVFTTILVFFLLLSLGAAAQTQQPPGVPSQAQPWQVQTLNTRSIEGGQTATVALAVRSPASVPVKHVLLHVSPYSIAALKVANGNTAMVWNVPWVTASAQLNERGIAVAFADIPSDANKRGLPSRPPYEVAADITAILRQLKQQFPGVLIHLAGFGYGAGALIDVATGVQGFERMVIVSGDFSNYRSNDWSHLKQPVLLIHAPSTQCDHAPFLEAEFVARKNHFTLVQAGYKQAEPKPNCAASSHHVLSKLEVAMSTIVAQWFDGVEPPATIGHHTPQRAWREQLVNYTAPATFGSNLLEMTLLFPPGAGPHPVLVFNHGDIEIDTAWMRYKRRYVEMVVAREFLQLGWAVAFPSRPGVGLSEGTYRLSFQVGDADATYKARVHVESVLPAFEYLKAHPDINPQRIIVAGQSAGGYVTMYLASMNLPGVVGAVDFSGGRTDKRGSDAAGYLNNMMVSGFAELGKSTRVPTLWVFAENDSRYTANTIRASHQAFVEAGGKATLALSPPIEGDGHFVYQKPELWRAALKEYLAELDGAGRGQ